MGTIHFLQHLFGPHLHLLFLFFTRLGNSSVLWPPLLLYCWLVDPTFARRLSIAFAASFLTNRILKEMFDTQRPFQIDQLVSTASAERTATGHGFPSGHSQNAATFYLAFAFRYPRRWIWIAAGLIVLLVGLSRLYLGVHLPEGVAGGFVLGAIFAWAAGGWSGLRVWRPSWNVLIGAVTLVLAFPVGAGPGANGPLAGCVAAPPDCPPPSTVGGKIGMVLGGAAAMALTGFLLYWLPGRLSPEIQDSPALAYLLYLAASLVGFVVCRRVCETFTPQPLSPIPPPIPAGERGAPNPSYTELT